ncbi:MAG: polyprenyl synthetase family protein [Candidatus Aenigmarchaeota archaeon]|nr:polyprenyl synthetase family protein [Candidatus Aenigmarchaeota archaeon]
MNSEIEKLLAELGPEFEKEILRVIPREGVPNLHDAVWYHLDSGGKRLRPALAVVACRALGGDSGKVMPFAAACELLHNWFLVHDDIEDGDSFRRGKEAVWKKFGFDHGINVGDFMSEKVYELILLSQESGLGAEETLQLAKVVAETCSKTAEGQTMDMNLRKENNPSEEAYMETIKRKTGWYFTLPIVGGAIVAKASDEIIRKIREFGLKAGPAFQIADDLLDLTSGKGREDIGADIKEGKRSLMVVHCNKACSPGEKEKLFETLNKPREQTSQEDVLWVKSLFEKHGSLEYAREKARKLVGEAKEISTALPKEAMDILDSFASYVIERTR